MNTFCIRRLKGFTLIELLVVIAIIGILASIIIASLNSARQKSRDARRIADLKQIQTALALYFHDHNEYPPTASMSTDLPAGNYMSVVSKDPLGADYTYELCATTDPANNSYHLGASLEDVNNSALNNATGVATPTGCAETWLIKAAGACTAIGGTSQGIACYDLVP